MASWWNGKLMKWQVNEMASQRNAKSMKWQVDEMASWWNGKLIKWQVDEMASWWNGKLIKWQVEQNTQRQIRSRSFKRRIENQGFGSQNILSGWSPQTQQLEPEKLHPSLKKSLVVLSLWVTYNPIHCRVAKKRNKNIHCCYRLVKNNFKFLTIRRIVSSSTYLGSLGHYCLLLLLQCPWKQGK